MVTTPSPTPTPGAQSGAGQQLMDEAGLLAPASGAGSSSKSLFDLPAQISGAPVNPGGLLPVSPSNPSSGVTTAEDVLKAFVNADPSSIAQIQAWLFKAGFYDSSTNWADIHLGVISPTDIAAFKKVVTVAAQTSTTDGQGNTVPGIDVGEYLQKQAAWGVYNGLTQAAHANITGAGGGASGSTLVLHTPDPKYIGQVVDSEFKKLLGHKPSPSERAGFIAAYTSAYQNIERSNFYIEHGMSPNGTAPDANIPGPPGAFPDTLPTLPPGVQPSGNALANIAKGAATASDMALTPTEQMIAGNLDTTPAAQANVNEINAWNTKNQQFLALANQPLPGMPGYSSVANGGVNTVTEQAPYDPQSFADEWINQHHTAEEGAHSATDVFSNFLSIIKGGMG